MVRWIECWIIRLLDDWMVRFGISEFRFKISEFRFGWSGYNAFFLRLPAEIKNKSVPNPIINNIEPPI